MYDSLIEPVAIAIEVLTLEIMTRLYGRRKGHVCVVFLCNCFIKEKRRMNVLLCYIYMASGLHMCKRVVNSRKEGLRQPLKKSIKKAYKGSYKLDRDFRRGD